MHIDWLIHGTNKYNAKTRYKILYWIIKWEMWWNGKLYIQLHTDQLHLRSSLFVLLTILYRSLNPSFRISRWIPGTGISNQTWASFWRDSINIQLNTKQEGRTGYIFPQQTNPNLKKQKIFYIIHNNSYNVKQLISQIHSRNFYFQAIKYLFHRGQFFVLWFFKVSRDIPKMLSKGRCWLVFHQNINNTKVLDP